MTRQPQGEIDIRELVTAYHRYGETRSDADFWAWDRITDIIRGPTADKAWEVVVALVRSAPDQRLEYVGAGPVEDLVCTHGATLIDRITDEARRDPRFCEALASIWLVVEDIPEHVLSQLQAVTNGQIRVATQAAIDAANEGLD
jgi:hypothetical protein